MFMRIQSESSPGHSPVLRAVTRTCISLALGMAALSAGACARNQAVQPESRLGAPTAQETHRWNGNGIRRGYDTKNLAAPGQDGPAGERAGGAVAGDTVLFTSDNTDLTPEAKSILDGYAAQLRQKPVRAVSIEGHADERGTREYNLALGARRAAAVKSYLLSKGMLEAQVRTISFGKERPVATCDDISCWARNRRAQVIVVAK
jgi:peptidoglycan-associated lipoprotein